MPHWGERLDPVTIKDAVSYAWSLGGGEEFVEVAADPAGVVDEEAVTPPRVERPPRREATATTGVGLSRMAAPKRTNRYPAL